LDFLQTGRFKVFDHLADWLEEFRLYHRKNGRIVDERDDLMSSFGDPLRSHDAAPGQDEAAAYDPATHQHWYDLLIVDTTVSGFRPNLISVAFQSLNVD
jgi:hypothetical protein